MGSGLGAANGAAFLNESLAPTSRSSLGLGALGLLGWRRMQKNVRNGENAIKSNQPLTSFTKNYIAIGAAVCKLWHYFG